MKKGTIALLAGFVFGVILVAIGVVLVTTTYPSCPSFLYDQDLYYGGAVVASFSLMGLAYIFRERVTIIGVSIAIAAAFVALVFFLGGFVYGLCGTFL